MDAEEQSTCRIGTTIILCQGQVKPEKHGGEAAPVKAASESAVSVVFAHEMGPLTLPNPPR